jgi:hypothetical protein
LADIRQREAIDDGVVAAGAIELLEAGHLGRLGRRAFG